MFPNKSPNARVLWNNFVDTVRVAVIGLRSFYWYVVDVGYCEVRNFGKEDVGDVVMEYRNGITPTHRESAMSQGAVGCLESGKVARIFRYKSLVVANIEIEHRAAGSTSELFGEIIWSRSDAGMLNGDFVERLETVDDAKRFSVLLYDAEPARPIGRVRRLIDSSCDFALQNFADFLVESRRYRNVLLNPRDMRRDWKLDWGKIFGLETTSLFVGPRESLVVLTHKTVHQLPFFGP